MLSPEVSSALGLGTYPMGVSSAGARSHNGEGGHKNISTWAGKEESLSTVIVVLGSLKDPLEDARVLTVSGPQEGTVSSPPEPVDEEYFGKLVRCRASADVEPMLHVIRHVVAAEGQHCKRVMAHLTALALGCSSHLGTDGATNVGAMVPIERLVDERHNSSPPATKEDGRDGDTLGIFPLRVEHRALICRSGKPSVGVGRRLLRRRCPVAALP